MRACVCVRVRGGFSLSAVRSAAARGLCHVFKFSCFPLCAVACSPRRTEWTWLSFSPSCSLSFSLPLSSSFSLSLARSLAHALSPSTSLSRARALSLSLPPPFSLADVHGVEWLPFWAFRSIDEVDVAVMWRNFDSVWLAPRATRRYLWVHDPLALASDQVLFSSCPVYGVDQEWVPSLSRSLLQKSPIP